MKKLLFSIVLLFSMTIQAEKLSDKLTGVWSSERTSYYVVILHDSVKGYEFINFSFEENKSLPEEVVEKGRNYVKTRLVNIDQDYEIFITYTIKKGKLHCKFEGDATHTSVYKRYWIMTN